MFLKAKAFKINILYEVIFMKRIISVLLTILIVFSGIAANAATTSYDKSKLLKEYNYEDATLFGNTYYAVVDDPTGNAGNKVLKTESSGSSNAYLSTKTTGTIVYSYDVYADAVDFTKFSAYNKVFRTSFKFYDANGDATTWYLGEHLGGIQTNEDNNGLCFRCTGGIEYTEFDIVNMELDTWYRFMLVMNPADSTINGYIINLSTGEKTWVFKRTNTPVYGVSQAEVANAGSDTIYMDNVRIYTVATENSVKITSGDMVTANVTLKDDVKSAKLYIDGTEIAVIDNKAGDTNYIVSDIELGDMRAVHSAELLCYDGAGSLLETVGDEFSYSFILEKNLALNKTEATVDSGATSTVLVSEPVENWEYIEFEADFSAAAAPTTGKFEAESRFDGTYGPYYANLVNAGTVAQNGTMTVNTQYKFKAVFENVSGTKSAKFYINEAEVYSKNFTKNKYYGIKFTNGTNQSIVLSNMKSVQKISADLPGVLSYTDYNGSPALLSGAVPSSAKSVTIGGDDKYTFAAENIKLYKDNAEITGVTPSVENGKISFATTSLSEGDYLVKITNATYDGVSIAKTIAVPFSIEKKFEFISPADNASVTPGNVNVVISAKEGCESVELYADGSLVEILEPAGGICTVVYPVSHMGVVSLEAKAIYSDGSNEIVAVSVNASGDVCTFSKSTNPSQSKFTQITENLPADAATNGKTYWRIASSDGTEVTASNGIETSYTHGKVVGTAVIEYDVKIDDVAAVVLGTEGKSFTYDSSSSTFKPYALNQQDLLSGGTVQTTSLTYKADNWYRIELRFNMREATQSVYITDLATGEKMTAAEDLACSGLTANAYSLDVYKIHYKIHAGNQGKGFEISNISMKNYEEVPKMTTVTANGEAAEDDCIETAENALISLSSDLYDDTLANYVTVLKDGTEVTASSVYDKTAKTLTVTPAAGFEAGHKYSVQISGNATINSAETGFVNTKTITVMKDGVFISPLAITANGNNRNASVYYVNKTDEDIETMFFIATYSGNRMTNISVSKVDSLLSRISGKIEIGIDVQKGDDLVKAFLWNGSTLLAPLVNALTVAVTEE